MIPLSREGGEYSYLVFVIMACAIPINIVLASVLVWESRFEPIVCKTQCILCAVWK